MDSVSSAFNSLPGISLSMKRARILIYQATIKAIGEPDYIRFLFNPERKRLAIQACEYSETDSFRVPSNFGYDREFEITSTQMQKLIGKSCGWARDKTYRIFGVVHSEYALVEFDLEQAVLINEEM